MDRKSSKEQEKGPENCTHIFEFLEIAYSNETHHCADSRPSVCRALLQHRAVDLQPGLNPMKRWDQFQESTIWAFPKVWKREEWGMEEWEAYAVKAACHRLGKTSLFLHSPLPPTSLLHGKLTKIILQKYANSIFIFIFNCISTVHNTAPQAAASARLRSPYIAVWDWEQTKREGQEITDHLRSERNVNSAIRVRLWQNG